MAIFGKDGFMRKQEAAFAKKLLIWKYNKAGIALPDDRTLSAQALLIVDDAHVVAQKSGRKVLEIIKDAVKDIKKK